MSFYFSPYKLKTASGLQVQEGCLIKLVEGDFFGVADICPKQEFKDVNWQTQLSKRGSLFQRAMQLANEDLNARRQKVSLLKDKPLRNNILVQDISSFDFSEFKNKKGLTFKIKFSKNADSFIRHLVEKFSEPDVKLRLDMNAKLSDQEFELFLKNLTPELHHKIEYIEDPCPFSEKWFVWNAQVPLACDFEKPGELLKKAKENLIFIFKPSREEIDLNVRKFTLTSAMDHPVGFAHGLRIAQELYQNESGFSTLDYYEPTVFNRYFDRKEEWVNFAPAAIQDTGIGMTEELNGLNWLSADRMSID